MQVRGSEREAGIGSLFLVYQRLSLVPVESSCYVEKRGVASQNQMHLDNYRGYKLKSETNLE